ncbi:MAG: NAD(P)/FAD-dependent oxidoreductase [Chloroflexi bacterium]|nr:NAD(P)/FAD-dependent oxidoreductase [Chloroflexota bacterium]
MSHYLILGVSAAGLTAIDAIRQRDKDGPIIVVSKEPEPCYSRVALPYILSGEKNMRQITLQEPGYFKANNADVIWGVGAASLDAKNKTVTLEDGRNLTYDKLLVATGSASRVPPIQGIEEADACYHWTLEDTQRIEKALAGAKSCFVIGAGFISLLTVSALIKKANLNYTIVEIADQVMPQLLDREGGEALERAMQEKGIEVVLGDSVSAVEKGKDGACTVHLKSGKAQTADMVVCGTGVRPNIDFLKDSGLDIASGVRTNERQETSLPDVWAAGDCAEGADFLSGEPVVHAIWPTAIDQGRVAGANMAGDSAAYPGSLSWNVTELFGLASASIGEFRDRPEWEAIVFHSPATNVYRKILIDRDNRMVGVVVIGRASDVQDLGVVQSMIRRKSDVSRWKHMLAGEKVNYGMMAFETLRQQVAR